MDYWLGVGFPTQAPALPKQPPFVPEVPEDGRPADVRERRDIGNGSSLVAPSDE